MVVDQELWLMMVNDGKWWFIRWWCLLSTTVVTVARTRGGQSVVAWHPTYHSQLHCYQLFSTSWTSTGPFLPKLGIISHNHAKCQPAPTASNHYILTTATFIAANHPHDFNFISIPHRPISSCLFHRPTRCSATTIRARAGGLHQN